MHRTIGAVGVRRLSGGPDVCPAEASGRGRPAAVYRLSEMPAAKPTLTAASFDPAVSSDLSGDSAVKYYCAAWECVRLGVDG